MRTAHRRVFTLRYRIPEYHHATGRHCGSGSLVNLCRFKGQPLSEPMVIGLGAALTFGYFSNPALSPSHGFLPRSPSLEEDFCQAVGITLTRHSEKDPERAWQGVRERVAQGEPVLLNSDIYELRYFASKTHFNGHKTLLVGFDDEQALAIISDTEFGDEQSEPLESLARARASRHMPLPAGGSPWYSFEFPDTYRALPQAAREAIGLQARRMIEAKSPFGTAGLAAAARDIPNWKDAEDSKWAARFGYQIIERRGTGGGAFRKMYAEFLHEVAPQLPEVAAADLPAQMDAIAAAWTRLAAELKTQSEQEAPEFSGAARLLDDLAARETAYYQAALEALER